MISFVVSGYTHQLQCTKGKPLDVNWSNSDRYDPGYTVHAWSKLHSSLWRYTIYSNLSSDRNKLWLQQYGTANNSIFHKMTTAANKTTYRYF